MLTSKSVTDENYAEKAILSATLAGNDGLTYDSKNNLILSGVKIVSSGNINLKGKDVEINPLETKSYNKHEKVKKASQVLLVQKEYQYHMEKIN